MHRTERLKILRGWARSAAVVALSAGVLAACAKGGDVRLRAAGGARPPTPPPAAPAEVFQGEASSVNVGAGEIVVAAHLAWAPVIEPLAEDRRVVVRASTTWQAAEGNLEALHVGQEVQVKADRGPDGGWLAQEVQVIDVD